MDEMPNNKDNPLPYAGNTLPIPIEPTAALEKVAKAIINGQAFPIDPDASDDDPEMRVAKISLGTLLMNFKVDADGEAIFGIGMKGTPKINVFRESQSDEFLAILKTLGAEDPKVFIVNYE